MVYIDYVILKQSYDKTYYDLKELLDKKELAFTRTQPNAIRYDGIKVISSGSDASPVEDYIIDTERLDRQIEAVSDVLANRDYMLALKLTELRESKEIDDRIFLWRYVDNIPVADIARRLYFSSGAIYHRLKRINKRITNETLK